MDDDWLTDLLIDDKIMITKSVIIPAVSGLYRPTGLLFKWKLIARSDHNISHYKTASLWLMCKNNNRLISDEQKILQTISLQDYVKRLWNHSNTKIPVTIGKGTDTAKPRSKARHAGQWPVTLAIVYHLGNLQGPPHWLTAIGKLICF